MHRRFSLGLVMASIALLAAGPVLAQGWPNKPVKLVVPYPPGGPTDIVARVIAERLAAQTGQTFVVENKAGAGGNLGAEAVARAPADGYTLLVATTAHAINMTVFKALNYDVQRDFVPVSLLTQGPLVLVVHPGFGAASVKDVIAKAKASPGGVPYASSGNGQSTHLSAELFASMAGVKLNHVPYKGSAPALNDVIAGQVPMMFDTMLSAMPHVKSGALKALAITGEARSPAAPDLPTLAESGLPGYQAYAWNGLLAPAGTPPEVISRLSDELKKALSQPAVQERFGAQGFAATWTSPAQTTSYLAAEIDKWRAVALRSGAKVE
ncbi:tripartite tricarboxylate transporter substrate binding protein [Ideonella sp. A 288]|uniref:tripartite tricarboxylate transporter substrate binding protein n=1 Tax=Ideonella sp. A 288 TaxID=1962181 RepID=UPI000B4C08A1|nr:tripartite tricarboxylate transporter substrate binding protein [Ideonella sp. A 288]